jgi:uncharacterized membrane protein YbhN (UPF0104 family)
MPRTSIRPAVLLPPLLGAILLAVLGARLLTADNLGDLAAALGTARFAGSFGAALLLFAAFGLLLGAYRWKLIFSFSRVAGLGFRECLELWLACCAFDLVAPAGSAKLLAGLRLERARGIPFAKTASTLVTKKYLNLLATALIVTVAGGFQLFATGGEPLHTAVVAVAAGTAAVLALGRPLARLLGAKLSPRGRLGAFLGNLALGFSIPPARTAALLGLSVVTQAAKIGCAGLVFHGLGLPVPAVTLAFLYPVVATLSALPLTPAGLGVREALVVALFASAADGHLLLAGGLALSLIEVLLPALAGIVVLQVRGRALLSRS